MVGKLPDNIDDETALLVVEGVWMVVDNVLEDVSIVDGP